MSKKGRAWTRGVLVEIDLLTTSLHNYRLEHSLGFDKACKKIAISPVTMRNALDGKRIDLLTVRKIRDA